MKKIAWIIVLLLVGSYFVNSYIEDKAKRKVERDEKQRIEQSIKSLVEEMVSRTNAFKDWESNLNKGKSYRFEPILTIELEKLWLLERPILFVGTIKDISTYDEKRYIVLFERDLLSRQINISETDLQLSLLAPKTKIDAFLEEHPKIFKKYSYKNGIAVVAKVGSIKTNYVAGVEGERDEIKVGQGELIDLLFIGEVRL